MRNGAGLSHCAGLGKDESGPVAGVAGGFPDFLLLGIQEAIHIEGFSSVEGGWVLGFDQMDLEPSILGELEVETSRPVSVGLHFPPVDVGYHPHEDLAFLPIALLYLPVGGDEVDQPDLVVFPEVPEGRWKYQRLIINGIGCFVTVSLCHQTKSEGEGEDRNGGKKGGRTRRHRSSNPAVFVPGDKLASAVAMGDLPEGWD